MKNMIIKFIKKHPSLYNLAKKVNRRLNRIKVNGYVNSDIVFYAYIMKNEKDLELIKKHYDNFKSYNTKLLVILDNLKVGKNIHKYIRENVGISFASFDYFKTYHKQLTVKKIVFLNYNSDKNDYEILNYVK